MHLLWLISCTTHIVRALVQGSGTGVLRRGLGLGHHRAGGEGCGPEARGVGPRVGSERSKPQGAGRGPSPGRGPGVGRGRGHVGGTQKPHLLFETIFWPSKKACWFPRPVFEDRVFSCFTKLEKAYHFYTTFWMPFLPLLESTIEIPFFTIFLQFFWCFDGQKMVSVYFRWLGF